MGKLKETINAIKGVWGKTPEKGKIYRSSDIAKLQKTLIKQRANHYEAAFTNRIRDDWPFSSSVPYTDIGQSLDKIIARSRKEIDNNGIASGIRRTIVNNVWGEGPVVQAQVKNKNGDIQKTVNDELEYAWLRHSDEMDATGHSDFNLFGRLALETIVSSGTVITNRVSAKKGQFLNLTYQMLEPDVLDSSKDDQKVTQDQNKRDKQILHGVGVDGSYRPIEYFIKGLNNAITADFMSHFYVRNRPNQVIGVPWLHASLPDLFDYRQLKEDHMVKSRLLADIALWLDHEDSLFPGDAVENTDGEPEWEPGMFIRTKKKPEVIQADGDLNTALKPLLNRVLLDACCGIGTSYMAVSRDMDGVNFAASRTNLNEDRSGYKAIRSWLTSTFCQNLWNSFVLQCVLEGKTSLTPDVFIKDPYKYTRVSFQFPSWDWVDPRADSDAIVNIHSAGLSNLSEICAKRGKDWRDFIDQKADEYLYMEKVAKDKGVPIEELQTMVNEDNGGNNNAEENETTES